MTRDQASKPPQVLQHMRSRTKLAIFVTMMLSMATLRWSKQFLLLMLNGLMTRSHEQDKLSARLRCRRWRVWRTGICLNS